MKTRYILLLLLGNSFLSVLLGQEILPTLTSVEYQIQADSLSRTNNPQDVTVTITASSVDNVNELIVIMDNITAFWTVVSARLGNQSLWLISSQTPSEKQNVLAWSFNREDNSLHIYPREDQLSSDLIFVARLNLLRPNTITKRSTTTVDLLAEAGNVRYQCVTVGTGNEISFR